MTRKHWTVQTRLDNIASVREWCEGKSERELTPEFRKALLRKIMVNLGVTP